MSPTPRIGRRINSIEAEMKEQEMKKLELDERLKADGGYSDIRNAGAKRAPRSDNEVHAERARKHSDVKIEVRVVPASEALGVLDTINDISRARKETEMNEVAAIRAALEPTLILGRAVLKELEQIADEAKPLLDKVTATSLRDMDLAGLPRTLTGDLEMASRDASPYGSIRTLQKYIGEQAGEIVNLKPAAAQRLANECRYYIEANLDAPANARARIGRIQVVLNQIAKYLASGAKLTPRKLLQREPPLPQPIQTVAD